VKPDLLEILRCPVCRGELALTVASREGDEIATGSLTCAKCAVTYPIADGIPDLLPPDERD
jgi:uncharacterized protein